MQKARALKKGDTIGIIAPSGPSRSPELLEKAIDRVRDMGFKVKPGRHIGEVHGFLAGSDEHRLADFNELFSDPEVDGIFCLKGGYGTPRFSYQIDPQIFVKYPKVLVGYSDVTTLHLVANRAGLITFHGPMPYSDMIEAEYDSFSAEHLLEMITSTQVGRELKNPQGYELQTLAGGKAAGQLAGGNLTLINRAMGTPYELDTSGKILFIEDVGEEPYQIDGYLSQLRAAGLLQKCAGFLIGDWNDVVARKTQPSLTIDEVVDDLLVPLGKPILSNLRAGHCEPKLTLPMGAMIEMDADAKKIIITESCLME